MADYVVTSVMQLFERLGMWEADPRPLIDWGHAWRAQEREKTQDELARGPYSGVSGVILSEDGTILGEYEQASEARFVTEETRKRWKLVINEIGGALARIRGLAGPAIALSGREVTSPQNPLDVRELPQRWADAPPSHAVDEILKIMHDAEAEALRARGLVRARLGTLAAQGHLNINACSKFYGFSRQTIYTWAESSSGPRD
ncbi:hypothetical protein [Schaalia sp. lx-100]|uniref:hypothetical protein n=1 Tax=Schaalia sp. lx-100 TaxID=2899081 RepID=UPI001E4765CF|nr:hypothetical protein [Schaalia sp. lx-100]MCD4558248.1 hypothetical protein [Schaalia sp. lx-100]